MHHGLLKIIAKLLLIVKPGLTSTIESYIVNGNIAVSTLSFVQKLQRYLTTCWTLQKAYCKSNVEIP